jgi:RNA polymerase sigma-70 factor (ECF subfamily)
VEQEEAMTDPSREEALRRWRQGREPEALGELLKAQRDRAYSAALRLVGSPADAEDAVQEAFLKLMSREKGFDTPAEFDVSVYRAVFQCSMDALRRRRRRVAREAGTGEKTGAVSGAGTEAGLQMSEEEMQVLRSKLRTAVDQLPDEERAAAVLCYYQGLSELQASEVLEVPRTTLRRRLSRAVGGLRRRLGRDGAGLSAAALVGLLTGEGLTSAPQSLCSALDAALPGRSCAQLPALPRPESTPFVPAAGGALKTALTAAGLLGATALGLVLLSAASSNHSKNVQGAGPAVGPGGNVRALQSGGTEKKEEPVKKKLTGLTAVAGGLLLSGVAAATEPSADVAAVIAQIKARQAAKKVAATKDAADRAKTYPRRGYYGQ